MPTVRYTVMGGRIVAEKRGGVRKFYSSDALGSTVALYDDTQAKTDTFTYWPYGETRTRTGSTATKYKFVGTLFCREQADGGIYMQARVEQPKDGRWMTVDPIWPSLDPYAYVLANPATLTDSNGRFPDIRCGNQKDYWRIYDALVDICGFGSSNFVSQLDACIGQNCVCPTGGPLPTNCISDFCNGMKSKIDCIGKFGGTPQCKRKTRPCNCSELDADGITITLCQCSLYGYGTPDPKCSNMTCVLLHEIIHRCGAVHHSNKGLGATITKEEDKQCFDTCVEMFPGCTGYGIRG